MAKTQMICPFSKQMCRECPQYRGRHYYLCFNASYRGCLEASDRMAAFKTWSRTGPAFEMPAPLPPSSKWLILNEFAERKEK